jgi:hypothetical protein
MWVLRDGRAEVMLKHLAAGPLPPNPLRQGEGENFVCAWIGLMLLPESGPADGSDLLACVVYLRVTGEAL